MVKVGNIYKAKLKMLSKEYFALIKVEALYKQPLREMDYVDALKEGYESLEEFKEIWIKINGDWNPEQVVDVVEFYLVADMEEVGVDE